MFQLQEASVDTIKMIKTVCLAKLIEYYYNVLVKMKKASNHIWFNKVCKKSKIVLKYIKMTCRHKSPEAQRASKKCYS